MRPEERGLRVLILNLFLLCLACFPLPLAAQNALILIPHTQAGPNLPSADYTFAEWIRWPVEQPELENRILSLAAGVDLKAQPGDASFVSHGLDGWTARNGAPLQRRGLFDARASYLGSVTTTVVAKPGEAVSPRALLLALDVPDAVVQPRSFEAALPTGGLVIYAAATWDDARAIANRVSGRSLTLEYPPAEGQDWSRYWLRGPWPRGVPTERDLGVPGLVRARSALGLLLRPSSFAWSPTDAGQWGGPNRWLEHGHGTGVGVRVGWFLMATFVVAWALAQVMNEDRGPFVSEMLVLVALSPAAIVLAGAAERFGGLEAWPVWLTIAFAVLYGASLLLGLVVRRTAPESHPLWAPCLVGLAALVLFDPLWSDLSGRFGPLEAAVPGEAMGAWVAYLAGAVAFARGRWLGRTLVAAALVWGAAARPWWVDGHASLLVLPAVVLLAAEGLFRPLLLVVLALLPTGLLHWAREGVAWNPDDLLAFADERNATNLWRHATFFVSPLWLGSLAFLASVGLVGNRFLGYRLRKLLRHDPRLRALPWTAVATLALGVTEPLALPAVPILVLGTLVALAYDGLRANA